MRWAWLTFAILLNTGTIHAQTALARQKSDAAVQALARGQSAKATKLFDDALKADPDYLAVFPRAVPHWLATAQLHKARAQLERVTLRHPDYAYAWYALALVYRRSDHFKLAVMAYREYLRFRPSEAAPYFGLGIALLRSGREAEAGAALRRFISLSGTDKNRFTTEAERLLKRLPKGRPVHPTPRSATAEALAQRGQCLSAEARGLSTKGTLRCLGDAGGLLAYLLEGGGSLETRLRSAAREVVELDAELAAYLRSLLSLSP